MRLANGWPAGPGIPRIALATAASATATLPLFLVGALGLQIRAGLGLDRHGLAVAVATLLSAAAITSTPLGRRAQRVGPVVALRDAALLTLVATLAIAAVPSFSLLLPCMVIAGAGIAYTEAGGNLLLALAGRPRRLGFAFGAKQSAPPAASLLAGLAVPALAMTLGWRSAFVVAAALAATVALVAGRSWSVVPRRDGRSSTGAWRRSTLVALAAAIGLDQAAATVLLTFLVDGAVTAGLPEIAGGLTLSAAGLATVLVRFSTGVRADRRGVSQFGPAGALMCCGGLGFLLMATQVPGIFVFGAVTALGLGWGFSAMYFFSLTRADPSAAGAASGIVLTGGFIGSVAAPLVFSAVVDAGGYPVAWLLAAGWISAGGVLVILAGRQAPEPAETGDEPGVAPQSA